MLATGVQAGYLNSEQDYDSEVGPLLSAVAVVVVAVPVAVPVAAVAIRRCYRRRHRRQGLEE